MRFLVVIEWLISNGGNCWIRGGQPLTFLLACRIGLKDALILRLGWLWVEGHWESITAGYIEIISLIQVWVLGFLDPWAGSDLTQALGYRAHMYYPLSYTLRLRGLHPWCCVKFYQIGLVFVAVAFVIIVVILLFGFRLLINHSGLLGATSQSVHRQPRLFVITKWISCLHEQAIFKISTLVLQLSI